MRHQGRQRRSVHPAAPGQNAVLIHRLSRVAQRPVVDQGIAGACIESDQVLPPLPHPGDIADAAQIQHRQRPLRQGRRQGLVIERHEGRALPAIGDIGAAEIAHRIDAREPCQQTSIADLPCSAFLGLVQHRLAVEAEQPDIRRLKACFAQQIGQRAAVVQVARWRR